MASNDQKGTYSVPGGPLKAVASAAKKSSKMYNQLMEAQGVAQATGELAAQAQGMVEGEDDARLEEILGELPDQQTIKDVEDQLSYTRGFVDWVSGRGGIGGTLNSDQQVRLGRILEKRGRPDSPEARQRLLQGLVETVKTKPAYNGANFLFDPVKKALDKDAAEVLQTWAKQNLRKGYDTPKELYENLGKDIRRYQALQSEAMELTAQKLPHKPKEYIRAVVLGGKGGPVVSDAMPSFDAATNQAIAKAVGDTTTQFLYDNDSNRETLRLVEQGLQKGQSLVELEQILGDKEEAQLLYSNMYTSPGKKYPGEVAIVLDRDINGKEFLPLDLYQNAMTNALYRNMAQREGLQIGRIPPAKSREMREKARANAIAQIAPLRQGRSAVAFKDPYGAFRDFQEGKGVRANIVKLLLTAATVATLGADETFLGDIPDKLIRSSMALTLPRSAAGVLMEQGVVKRKVRPGEFFAPVLGDYGVTNALDGLLRLNPVESIAASFALATDDYAESEGSVRGRPAGVLKNMAENFDTPRHHRRIVSGAMHGARYMNEFGDVFINPFLGKFGQENPGLGRAAGMMGTLASYVVAPDALLAAAASTRLGAPAGRALAKATGMEFRRIVDDGAPIILRAQEEATQALGPIQNLDTDQLIEFDRIVQKRIREDKTGAASVFNYIAQFKTSRELSGLSVSLESGEALQEAIQYYAKVQERASELGDAARLKFAEAKATKDGLTKASKELEALDTIVQQAKAQTDGYEALLKTNADQIAEATARIDALRKTQGDTIPLPPDPSPQLTLIRPAVRFTTDQVMDALRVLNKTLSLKKFVAKHADSTGRVAGKTAKELKKGGLLELTADSMKNARPFVEGVARAEVQLKNLRATRKALKKGLKEVKAEILPKVNEMLPAIMKRTSKRNSASLRGAVKAIKSASKNVANQIKSVESTLSDARVQIAADEAVNVIGPGLQKEVYMDYMQNLTDLAKGSRDLLRLPTNVSDAMFLKLATKTTDDIAADADILALARSGLDESSDLLKLTDAELAEQIMTTEAMIKMFQDPTSFIHQSIRDQARLFSHPKAWAVKATITTRAFFDRFPVFRTNVQYLGIPVRSDIDREAKRMARKTQDIMDQLNLSVKNVEGIEAKKAVMDSILTTAGRTPDLAYKANIPGTPKAQITMTGLLGLDKPLATEMLHHLIGQARLRSTMKGTGVTISAKGKAGVETPFVVDEALGAAVTAYIPDKRLVRPSEFMANEFRQVQGIIHESLLAKADDLMGATGEQALNVLRQEIKSALGRVGVKYEVSSVTDVKVTQAIILGAMQSIWAERVFHIIGPRFNLSVGRAANQFMGLGRFAEDYIPQPVAVGDYVLLKSEARVFDDLVASADTPTIKATTDPSVLVKRGKDTVGASRSALIESKASKLLGVSSRRINKIEDGMVYFNTKEAPVPISQVVHRDIRTSMLDAFDGFAMFGLTNITNIGRKELLNNLGVVRDTYQRMLVHSLDAQGNVRMIPRALMDRFSESLDNIAKQLDESIADVKMTGPVAQVYAAAQKSASRFMSFFKRHILYGLLTPRPQYFMNMHFGEYAQMADGIGLREALPLSLMGSMGSVPVFGKSLQNSMFAMSRAAPAGKIPLPSATGATFNSALDKIFRATDDVLYVGPDGKAVTAKQFYAEAIEDGVGEYLRIDGIEKIIRDEINLQMAKNPNIFKTVYNGYEDYARIVELKIREVTRRQRMLLYAHLRINKKVSRNVAQDTLLNSMYDWSMSVSKLERRVFGEAALFYTLTKNGYAQVYRQLFEAAADDSLKTYLKKYIKGDTKVQRLEALSRFFGARAGFTDPFQGLTPEERKDVLAEKTISNFYTDYGIIGTGTVKPNMIDQMYEEAGFGKYNYARITPKLTTVEFATSTATFAANITAILAAGLIEAPYELATGKQADISVNVGKAQLNLLEEVTDTAMNPILGTMLETIYRDARGSIFQKSPYGRKMRPGDLALVQTLRQFGVDGAFATVGTDSQSRTRRIMLNPNVPLANEILWSIGRTEMHRAQMIAGLMFPGMAPAEIRALAENEEGRIRLEIAANLLNFGKAAFYNGADNHLRAIKTSKEQIAERVRVIKNQEELPLKEED